MRLNAQYASMVRTSLSVLGRLMRVQAVRQKREAIEGAANADAWTQHAAEQTMLKVVDQDAKRLEAAQPKAAPAEAPVEPPAADVDQRTEENVSEDGINSQDADFETWLSEQFQGQEPGQPDGSRLHAVLREAMAEARLAGWDVPADDRESPGTAGYGGPIGGETASA